MKIEAHGSFFEISEDGTICNMGHPDNIRPPWKALVEAIKQTYIENCADQLHSIYIRGSVARGLAVPNISDVDSFAITRPDSTSRETPWAEAAKFKLLNLYPFAAGVEFGLIPYENIFKRCSGCSVILKTQSVCVYGSDLQYEIQAYRPNREVIDQAFVLAKKIAMVEEEAATEEDPTELELEGVCTWLMKGVVRSGFELVIEEENVYTRDLYFCYTTFIKYFPDKEQQMRQSLEWAINPTSDFGEVLPFLQDFGQWLCQQIETRYPTQKRFEVTSDNGA